MAIRSGPMKRAASTGKIEAFVLARVERHPSDIAAVTAEKFGISRQAAHRHLARLVAEGKLTAHGVTRGRTYHLRPLVDETFTLDVTPSLAEHHVWDERVDALLRDLPTNVRDVCYYGFTEIVNNVIDHSESPTVTIAIQRTATTVSLSVIDAGVGIFRKLVRDLHLENEQHAALELSKGKLTTDARNHTGEGIFFSSRAFDRFLLQSGSISLVGAGGKGFLFDEALFPVLPPYQGTRVIMEISSTSRRDIADVFEQFASKDDDYRFSRTHVPVALARLGDQNLVSRSQAKRLLARLDRFEDVVLDFAGVETIGQGFADEVFRVFANQHPGVRLEPRNMTVAVERMVRRARARAAEDPEGGSTSS